MTGLSASASSACDVIPAPGAAGLHLWLCRREAATTSDHFLRDVLSRYCAVAPGQLQFRRGTHGKPALLDSALPLHFNLSGSGDRLALVISAGAPVGVDLEYCDPDRDALRLARRYFHPAEQADLQALGGRQRLGRFYDYWTLKEARVKAGGGSLAWELEATAFALRFAHVAPGEPASGTIAELCPADGEARWYALIEPFDDYRLALCCRSSRDFGPGLRQFDWPGSARRAPRLLALSAGAALPLAIGL